MSNCKNPSGIWAVSASMFELEKNEKFEVYERMKYIMT